jgi:neutral ceramidase
MLVGAAVTDITPAGPGELSGFAARTGVWERVRAPLSAQVLVFGTGRPEAVLVCADLLWWDPATVEPVRAGIAERCGVPAGAVLLHASHTHCAPTPGPSFSPLLGAPDPSYAELLAARVIAAAGQAVASMEPVTMSRGRGECRFGVNRRRVQPDGSVGGPDPDGVADPEVTVLRLHRRDGSAKAVLVHYTCHPVVTGDRAVSPDFPGAMRDRLAAELGGGTTIGFLQGCCGDINPALSDGDAYRFGDDEDIARFGGELATSALTALAAAEPVPAGRISVHHSTVDLPLEVPSYERLLAGALRSGIWGDWSRLLLAEPWRLADRIPLRLVELRLAEDATLLGFDAEVCVEYGLRVKEISAGAVLPIGYTNGMIGYLVTAEQLRLGGYEPDESYPYVYRPGRLAPAAEARVTSALAGYGEDRKE